MTDRQAADIVTGAWSYSGRFIAQTLLRQGRKVRSLTNHAPPASAIDPYGGQVPAFPFAWHMPETLAIAMQGCATLYLTYWHRHATHVLSVNHCRRLIEAAVRAGVQRVVYVSITHPDADSQLSYFAGKAQVEETVRTCGLAYTILRPSLFFGQGDVLLNNIAWACRHLPAFPVPRPVGYAVRPIHVQDMAELCVRATQEPRFANATLDACGPESFEFGELVRQVGRIVKGRAPRVAPLPIGLCHRLYRIGQALLRDQVLSRAELEGLAENRLSSQSEPLGTTRLLEYVARRKDSLGRRYRPEPVRTY